MKPIKLSDLPPEIRSQVEKQTTQEESLNKKNKFGAQKASYDGQIFDSRKEMVFAQELDLRKKTKELPIKVLKYETQVRYDIIVNDKNCGYYLLDFKVEYGDGLIRYFDVKGYKKGAAYALFRLKKKLVEAIYGIKIEEV